MRTVTALEWGILHAFRQFVSADDVETRLFDGGNPNQFNEQSRDKGPMALFRLQGGMWHAEHAQHRNLHADGADRQHSGDFIANGPSRRGALHNFHASDPERVGVKDRSCGWPIRSKVAQTESATRSCRSSPTTCSGCDYLKVSLASGRPISPIGLSMISEIPEGLRSKTLCHAPIKQLAVLRWMATCTNRPWIALSAVPQGQPGLAS